ncbi:hypothetical protein GCM10009119_04050 [Algoriphagus jejuensis]|uniref:SnoaL-like protein n=1 Tax=Algoriphagus jejuensis TaxID=419934 RepID=A0ABP3Y9C0_9BACT
MKSIKTLVLLAGLGLSLFSCGSSSDQKNAENVKLVEAYVKSVEAMDFDAMDSYLDENYLGVGPSYGDSINKEGAMINWKLNVETLYEKIEYTKSRFAPVVIPDGSSKGEWVANWSEMNITFKDGKSVTLWANTNYKIANGKIIESLTLYNEADALRQMDYVFLPID